jgi:hypothetical protein
MIARFSGELAALRFRGAISGADLKIAVIPAKAGIQ